LVYFYFVYETPYSTISINSIFIQSILNLLNQQLLYQLMSPNNDKSFFLKNIYILNILITNFNNDNFEAIESLERWDFISKERPCWRDLFYLRRKSHFKNKHSSLFKKPRRIRSRNRKFRGIGWWRRDHSLSIYCLLRRKSFRRRWFVPWINLVIYWERLLGSSHNGFKIFCFIYMCNTIIILYNKCAR
jgi:hypothetical protein